MRAYRDILRRWLSVIVHSPVPRLPLLGATALTAAAAVAAGPVAPVDPVTTSAGKQPAAVAAADEAASAGNAASPFRGTVRTPGGRSADSASTERAAKIAAAREKALRAEAGRRSPKPKQDQGSGHGKPDKTGPAAKGGKSRGDGPTERDLMPGGRPAGQSSFAPSAEQVRNAELIVRTGERMKLPPRAQVIAVATALQESKLENLGHLGATNDHDSLGLFQQRPSSGWGTPEQLTNPDYAAEQFYRALRQVPGYRDLPLTTAAQTVQVSAFPDAYAQWEQMAADLVRARHGEGPYAGIAGDNGN